MFIIGIAGGSGSGKTTVVENILKKFHGNQIVVISQDSYYKDNSHLPLEKRKKINYDHPDSIEFDLLIKHLDLLKHGIPIEMPTYSYITWVRLNKTVRVAPPRAGAIVEGILIFTQEKLKKLFDIDIKVFVDVPEDERLVRIIKRDLREKERTIDETLERYFNTVKPMHQQFIEPSKYCADIIIPQGGKNTVALDFLITVIKSKLDNPRAIKSSKSC